MRMIVFLFPLVVMAQTYVYGPDGRREVFPTVSEKVERKVLSEGPDGKVMEEVVQRRDANGNALPAEKRVTVEKKDASGASVVETTLYRADLNGRMQAAERSRVESAAVEQGKQTTTTVEVLNLNGSFQPVEKVSALTSQVQGKEVTTTSVYRPGASGGFVEAERAVSEKVPTGNGFKENVTEYEAAFAAGGTGQLVVKGQKVTVAVQNPDGSTVSQIAIYGLGGDGKTVDGRQLKLREEQLVTRKPGPENTVKESLAIRRPDVNRPEKVGEFKPVAERVEKVQP
jgi:hypothetical protein